MSDERDVIELRIAKKVTLRYHVLPAVAGDLFVSAQ